MKNYFSSNLKYLRNLHHLTQEELAKKIDKDYSTIGKWEKGNRSPIMADVIKISELFDIQIGDLILKDFTLGQSVSSISDVKKSIKQLPTSEMKDENKKQLVELVDTFNKIAKG